MGIEYRLSAEEYLQFKVNQQVKFLYIDFLRILENLRDERLIDEEQFESLRLRVLDRGNGTIRELKEELDKFNFTS